MSTHWPGASSDAAVRNIDSHSTMNNGRPNSLNIPVADTPAATRSVGGNFVPITMNPKVTAGNSTTASLACQPNPQ